MILKRRKSKSSNRKGRLLVLEKASSRKSQSTPHQPNILSKYDWPIKSNIKSSTFHMLLECLELYKLFQSLDESLHLIDRRKLVHPKWCLISQKGEIEEVCTMSEGCYELLDDDGRAKRTGMPIICIHQSLTHSTPQAKE